eukprot:1507827-Prymnesium_polylepis.1
MAPRRFSLRVSSGMQRWWRCSAVRALSSTWRRMVATWWPLFIGGRFLLLVFKAAWTWCRFSLRSAPIARLWDMRQQRRLPKYLATTGCYDGSP